MQFLQLLVGHAPWGTGHQAAGLLGLGEGNGVADRLLAGQQHHHPVHTEGQAAVGRCAHIESVHQEAELLLGLLEGQSNRLQHLALQGGVMDAQGAAAELKAIEHKVVGLGPGSGQGFGPLRCIAAEILRIGGAEGVVQGLVTVLVAVELEHREVHHPEEVPLVVVPVGLHHAQLLGQVLAHPVEGLVHRGGVAGTEQQQGAGFRAGAAEQLLLLLIAEVVLDGADRVDLTAVAHPDEGQATGTSFLCLAEHITTRLDPHVAHRIVAAGHRDALHRAAGLHGATEHLEAHVLHDVAHVGELHAVAGVGSVGAVALHGVMPGHAWEGPRQFDALHGLPDGADQ